MSARRVAGEDEHVARRDPRARARAQRTASPVPSGCSCTATSTPARRRRRSSAARRRRRSGRRRARAAAASTQSTMRRPSTGCRCFGTAERMRVPSPAAITAAAIGVSVTAGSMMAGAPGFEPGIAGPKPAALPLGYAPLRAEYRPQSPPAGASVGPGTLAAVASWREIEAEAPGLTRLAREAVRRARAQDARDAAPRRVAADQRHRGRVLGRRAVGRDDVDVGEGPRRAPRPALRAPQRLRRSARVARRREGRRAARGGRAGSPPTSRRSLRIASGPTSPSSRSSASGSRADHLVIESWHPLRGVERLTRR